MKQLVVAVFAAMIAAGVWMLLRHTLLWFEIVGVAFVVDTLAVVGSEIYDKHAQRKAEQPTELPEARWLNS